MTVPVLDVSVVICAYTEERWQDLVEAVESVQQQSIPPREIIVAIDHNERLLERTRTSFPGVIVVENKEAQGAGGSRNSGVAVAQGSLIAFLDDDAKAEPDWLVHLLEGFDNQHVLGIGGALEPIWVKHKPDWLPEEFYWVIGCDYKGMPKTTAPMRNLIAANMSMRREIFLAVGGFRSGFGKVGKRSGCDETELCIRINQQYPQGIWLYEPKAKVHHRVPAGRISWRYFRSRCYDEGLAKAGLSSMLGSGDSLASERIYTLLVLPQGVLAGIIDSLFHRKITGLKRSGAIIAGLVITLVGYLIGRMTQRSKENSIAIPPILTSTEYPLAVDSTEKLVS
jgi:glycosyltransferase involved in cell wall biosynthesis